MAMSTLKAENKMQRILDAQYHELLKTAEKLEGNVNRAEKEVEKARMVFNKAQKNHEQLKTEESKKAVRDAQKALTSALAAYNDAVPVLLQAQHAVAEAEKACGRQNAWKNEMAARPKAEAAAPAPAPAAAPAPAPAAAPAKNDAEALQMYAFRNLQDLWSIPKTDEIDKDFFDTVVSPFYGDLWGSCPSKDVRDVFLLFDKGHTFVEGEINLKFKVKSFVVLVSYHCVYNNETLDRLKITRMFDAKNEVADQFVGLINMVLRFTATSHDIFINGLKRCVDYMRKHDNVRGHKNPDETIDGCVATIVRRAVDAAKPAAGPRDDEVRACLDAIQQDVAETRRNVTELTNRVAKMEAVLQWIVTEIGELKKLHEQTVQRLVEVHDQVAAAEREVKALRTEVTACMKETEACRKKLDQTLAELLQDTDNDDKNTGQPFAMGCVPMPVPGCVPMPVPGCVPMPVPGCVPMPVPGCVPMLPMDQYWNASMPKPKGKRNKK